MLLRSRIREMCLLFLFLFNIGLEAVTSAIRQEIMKTNYSWKGKAQTRFRVNYNIQRKT